MKALLISAWGVYLAGGCALAWWTAPCLIVSDLPAQHRLNASDLHVCPATRANTFAGTYLKAAAKRDQPLTTDDVAQMPKLPRFPSGQGVLLVRVDAGLAGTINAGSTVAIIDDTGATTPGFPVLALSCPEPTKNENCSAMIAVTDANKAWQTKTDKLHIIPQ